MKKKYRIRKYSIAWFTVNAWQLVVIPSVLTFGFMWAMIKVTF